MQLNRLLTLVGFYATAQAASLNGKTASQMEASTDVTTSSEAVKSAATPSDAIPPPQDDEIVLELGAPLKSSPVLSCGLSSFGFPFSRGGNSCSSSNYVCYNPNYLNSLPDDFTIFTIPPSAAATTSYTVPPVTNTRGFDLPTTFRYVT
jgi:hypothetical protein